MWKWISLEVCSVPSISKMIIFVSYFNIFILCLVFFEAWADTVKKKELWRKNIKAEISLTYWSTSSLFFSVTFFYCYPYLNVFNAAWYIFFIWRFEQWALSNWWVPMPVCCFGFFWLPLETKISTCFLGMES